MDVSASYRGDDRFMTIFKRKVDALAESSHTPYSRNIKWQKCEGMDLNGFILKKINDN